MSERLTYLFTLHLQGKATAAEIKELMGLVILPGLEQEVNRLVEAAWNDAGETNDIPAEKLPAFYEKVFTQRPDDNDYTADRESGETPVIEMDPVSSKRYVRRWIAAASIILLIGLATYFLFFNKNMNRPDTAVAITTDVESPRSNRSMITLADGSRIYLDSATNGELVVQDNIRLVKLNNGQIVYQAGSGETATELKYNTLENPRGSRAINMTLSDGSKVWLNAGSSITYPLAFTGNERKISMTGEAYFEVAHDKTRPFYVSKGDMQVQVLGTHFNVNAYDDENDIKVTLLAGSVKVGNNTGSIVIKPGEQAMVITNQRPATSNRVDIEQVMAWKNGRFQFSDASIETIMKEISRWYDVEIIYDGSIKGHFVADVSRDVPVSRLLQVLELTERVHFTIEEKKIRVRP